MNNRSPFPFADFERALTNLRTALTEDDEVYMLLTGDTGTGKTALMRQLQGTLDRCRFRVVYFAHARKLSSSGLIRALAHTVRIHPRRSHPETVQALVRHLVDEPEQVLLWFDEAHELSPETLDEARTFAEADLAGARPVRLLLTGLPPLREHLQASSALWRRIGVREELTGLTIDEVPAFLEHHHGHQLARRLCPDGLHALFQRGRGVPGLMLPLFRMVLRGAPGKGRIDLERVEDALATWDLA